jgi:hypothetical protein
VKESQHKTKVIKVLVTIIFMAFFIILVTNSTKILKNPTNVFIVTNGSLSYEEPVEGYIIRDEVVLQGENYKNGMVQILSDGERAAKGESVFRYYSNSEENIAEQITELDEEINELIESTNLQVASTDITSLESQIEDTIYSMYNLNYLQKIQENKNKIDAYITKKTQITGNLSPANSYVKQLTDQRNALAKQLEEGSEIVTAPVSGLASYRVDGLEEILKVDDTISENTFEYLTSDLLNSFELKVGATIPLSNEKGKIVNNFKCYIVVPIDTEKAMTAQTGDTVTLRLANSSEMSAEIVYIKEEEKDRIIVFEINSNVSDLLEYRKISFEIIWWKYTGLKVSNSSLIEEDDKVYVERNKAGFTEKILVKVLRQNDTYSIVENYEDDELRTLGYTEDDITNRSKIMLYDEIVLH